MTIEQHALMPTRALLMTHGMTPGFLLGLQDTRCQTLKNSVEEAPEACQQHDTQWFHPLASEILTLRAVLNWLSVHLSGPSANKILTSNMVKAIQLSMITKNLTK